MASVHVTASVPFNGIVQGGEEPQSSDTDPENIPYHARENALPFTYGKVDICSSDLHSIEPREIVEYKRNASAQLSPRKSSRPSIAATCPLLRKTPSREEFEDMLMKRKVQTEDVRDLAYNESIQKELDELHKRLNTPLLGAKALNERQVEFEVPQTEITAKQKNLELVEKRSNTPTFPYVQKPLKPARCLSPYPGITGSAQQKLSNTVAFDESCLQQPSSHDLQQVECADQTKEVEPHLVKFTRNSSEFWYKPNMSRDEAVDLLRHMVPGTFLIRNSTTYPNAFGLVLRVAKPPPGVVTGPEYGDQLVRHFLLEPTTRGVRLMGCANEPIFTSLSAFVYEHSNNQISLPCTLIIPDQDLLSKSEEFSFKQKQVLEQGAACNVLYLFQGDMESLTGDDAVRKAVFEMHTAGKRPEPLEVHLKISGQGITLTDNTRKKFFRRHYPAKNISHFCMDPNNHFWSVSASDEGQQRSVNKSIFAFIARPLTGSKDNQCHVFCDLSSMQPASAIVTFANKVLPLHDARCKML